MSALPPDTQSQRGKVVSIRPTGSDGVVLEVQPEVALGQLGAGRFFMLRRNDPSSPAIPRPFSLYRQGENGNLEFLIKVIGPGTEALAEAHLGEDIQVLGPLGRGWPEMPSDGKPLVMLAGGIGSAPFHIALRDALRGTQDRAAVAPENLHLIYGGRHQGLLYDIEQFEELGPAVTACTDDGSRGFHGNVVQALEDHWQAGRLPEDVRLWTCGPEPMMNAVVRLAEKRGLDCWLSLETYMGCGVGICNGCAVFTREEGSLGDWPVAKCCLDGPVFAACDVRLD